MCPPRALALPSLSESLVLLSQLLLQRAHLQPNNQFGFLINCLLVGGGWSTVTDLICSNCFSEGKLFVEDETMNLNSFQLLKLKCAAIPTLNRVYRVYPKPTLPSLNHDFHLSKTHPPPKPGKFRLSFAQLDGHLMIIIKN